VQFRHASQNSTNDHLLHGENCQIGNVTVGDTANCALYIRVKLDGTYVYVGGAGSKNSDYMPTVTE